MRMVALLAIVAIGAFMFLNKDDPIGTQHQMTDKMAAQIEEQMMSSIKSFDENIGKATDDEMDVWAKTGDYQPLNED